MLHPLCIVMLTHELGELGYHEAAKRLNLKEYTTSRPDLDRGSDIIVCDGGNCITAQIKTLYMGNKDKSTATWSGSDNPTFADGCDGSALIIVLLNSDYNEIYSVIFPPNDVPDVKSITFHKEHEKRKYWEYIDRWEILFQ